MNKNNQNTTDISRILHIILGIIGIIFGLFVITYIDVAAVVLLFLLAYALIFIGISLIIASFKWPSIKPWQRYLEGFAGVLAIILSFVVIIYPAIGRRVLIILLAVALLLIGIRAISTYYNSKSDLLRIFGVFAGVLDIIFSFVVILFPGFGIFLLAFLLAFGLLLIGIEQIMRGFLKNYVAL